MFANLNLFQEAGKMASHASIRQRVVAENIANANTPSYRQRDVVPFQELARRSQGSVTLEAHRPGHMTTTAAGSSSVPRPHVVHSATQGPNGNTVSLEGEIMKTAQVRQQHETALAVYRSAMSVLRSVISQR